MTKANPLRTKKKHQQRANYERGLKRTHDLGVAPIYHHGFHPTRDALVQTEWEKIAKAWDKAHPIA